MPPSPSPEMLVIDLGGPGHQYFIVPQMILMCGLGGSAGLEEKRLEIWWTDGGDGGCVLSSQSYI